MYDLSRLNEDEFAWLCVSLLGATISPAVHLVSMRGPDGARDAVVYDSAPAGPRLWEGTWVFQFKHYPRDDASARSQVLRDAAKELPRAKRNEPGMRNYVLLTSARFTGVPASGFHDRAHKLKLDLSRAHGVNVDIWDGLELNVLLLRFPDIAGVFFPRETGRVIQPSKASAAPNYVRFLVAQGETLDDDTFFTMIDRLFLGSPWVLAPGSSAPAWALAMEGDNLALREAFQKLERELAARLDNLASPVPRALTNQGWLLILRALAEARMGRPRHSLRLVGQVSREARQNRELAAWLANIRSISFGKLDSYRAYERSTRVAVQIARETGNSWLEATIRLRDLHKRAWAGAESGVLMNNAQFEDRLRADLGSGWLPSVAGEHLRAQRSAYLALHLTWQEGQQLAAAEAIDAATHGFNQVADRSELSRMASELGRLHLRAGAPEDSLRHLRSGLKARIVAAEYPRVRYDLLWLGEAFQAQEDDLLAETSYLVALGLHEAMYGGEKSDAGVVRSLADSLSRCASQLRSQAASRRFDSEELLGLVCSATGLEVHELGLLADTKLVRSALVKYAT